MRILKRLPLVLATLAAGAFIGAGVVTVDNATSTPEPSSPIERVTADATPTVTLTEREPYEDEPGWDCHTMGNEICGTTESAMEAVTPVEVVPAPAYEEAVPWVPGAPINGEIREPYEDEPGFDCRIHGNNTCGVQVQGAWYVIQFDEAANPLSVAPRGF